MQEAIQFGARRDAAVAGSARFCDGLPLMTDATGAAPVLSGAEAALQCSTVTSCEGAGRPLSRLARLSVVRKAVR